MSVVGLPLACINVNWHSTLDFDRFLRVSNTIYWYFDLIHSNFAIKWYSNKAIIHVYRIKIGRVGLELWPFFLFRGGGGEGKLS